MIDAKHVHKLLECKYDFKHWIKDVISSFNFKDGIDYISYRYDNNGEQIIDNNSHVFRHDYYLFPKSILCIIYMKCDRSLFKDFIYDIFDCCNIKNDDRVLDIIHRSIDRYNKKFTPDGRPGLPLLFSLLYLIGELIGVPNTVMDSALHELKDRIDKDPKYKDVKNWLESLPKI